MELLHFKDRFSWLWILPFLLMLAGTIGLGYFVGQADFWKIISFYGLLFGGYVWVLNGVKAEGALTFFLIAALLLRGILVFAMPGLSDDVFRFIWDGRLLVNGINPFDQLPAYYIENQIQISGINQSLFEQLNSPEYFTIYPPVAQAIFALSCWLFPTSIAGATIVMKLFLFACEAGSIWLILKLLRHWKLPSKNVLIYALNPLIIVEITGNLHFEGAMIFFLLLAIWWLMKGQNSRSAVAMALSIASKLLPLLFLPFLIARLGWKWAIQYFVIIGSVLLLLFLPFVNGVFLQNFGNSLDLYFQKFEFNASVYYLIRWIGFQFSGYNLIHYIGPALAACTFFGIVTMAIREKKINFSTLPQMWLFAICLYLAFTTTVHPWYVSLPVVLCLFTPFRFPVLWSGLILLTYLNYSYDLYFENLWMVALEYIAVAGMLFFEFQSKRFHQILPSSN